MSIDGKMVKLMMGYLMHSATAQKVKPLDCFWAFSSRQKAIFDTIFIDIRPSDEEDKKSLKEAKK